MESKYYKVLYLTIYFFLTPMSIMLHGNLYHIEEGHFNTLDMRSIFSLFFFNLSPITFVIDQFFFRYQIVIC